MAVLITGTHGPHFRIPEILVSEIGLHFPLHPFILVGFCVLFCLLWVAQPKLLWAASSQSYSIGVLLPPLNLQNWEGSSSQMSLFP